MDKQWSSNANHTSSSSVITIVIINVTNFKSKKQISIKKKKYLGWTVQHHVTVCACVGSQY